MSHMKVLIANCVTFNNHYTVHFESLNSLGTIFVHIWHNGNKVPLDRFMEKPEKVTGYYGYLKPEDFVDLLYKVRHDSPTPMEFEP